MPNSPELLLEISRVVARCADNDDLKNVAAELNPLFPAEYSSKDKEDALEEAIVYALEANQPGYPVDGQPGILPCDVNLKEAVLREVEVMREADFDNEEHAQAWADLKKSLDASPETDFIDGVSVNCPDDYILSLDRMACAQLLRLRQAYPRF